jgi:hypothetical protein
MVLNLDPSQEGFADDRQPGVVLWPSVDYGLPAGLSIRDAPRRLLLGLA